VYDYDATGSDEISFEEGDVIRVLKREPNGVDDGWWMGELRTGSKAGTTGLFPSLVVEECYDNGEDSPDDSYSLASPQSSVAPPSFSPPRDRFYKLRFGGQMLSLGPILRLRSATPPVA
jgi:hypothetical protein